MNGDFKRIDKFFVGKLWNLCNVLRDDGIIYHQYVTELTYILFLKMVAEIGTEDQIPADYRWDMLASKSGIELKKFYKELLTYRGEHASGLTRAIYRGTSRQPVPTKKSGAGQYFTLCVLIDVIVRR